MILTKFSDKVCEGQPPKKDNIMDEIDQSMSDLPHQLKSHS